MIQRSQYDTEIATLERKLRELRRKRKAELRGTEPKKRVPMRRSRPKKRSAEIEAYWNTLREMGCIVTGKSNPTIHHIHSGSVADAGINRGGGEKVSDWLVLPLDIHMHSLGPDAIDGAMGVKTWEIRYGRQVDHINEIIRRTGIDVWERAGVRRPE